MHWENMVPGGEREREREGSQASDVLLLIPRVPIEFVDIVDKIATKEEKTRSDS